MFGYVKPKICELRVKEHDIYKAAYCGLCKAMKKRHGLLSTLTLSYDCCFLSLLLASLAQEEPCYKKCRCLHRCVQKSAKQMIPTNELDFAADVNLVLAYHKCIDDINDERKLSKRLMALLLRGRVKRLKGQNGELCKAVESHMAELNALEREQCSEPDRVADCFARLLCAIVAMGCKVDKNTAVAVNWFCYNLGRWIYLIDAADDIESDAKSGCYNPLLLANKARDDMAFSLYKSLSEADKALQLLKLNRFLGIIENIISLGCTATTAKVLKEKADESL